MMTTETTNAEEIGLLSLTPTEMPFTIAKTNTSATASSEEPTGWPSTKWPVEHHAHRPRTRPTARGGAR